jgi:hypothetical protein
MQLLLKDRRFLRWKIHECSARPFTVETAPQNLNKESQIMVSAMRGQGGLSCTERKNYEDTHNVEPVPGDGGSSEPL